jgi:hypothetical protein
MSEGEANFLRTWAYDKTFNYILKTHKLPTTAILTPDTMSEGDRPTQLLPLHPRMLLSDGKIAFVDGDGFYARPLVGDSTEEMESTEENIAKIAQFLNAMNWDATKYQGDLSAQQRPLHPRILIDENGKLASWTVDGWYWQLRKNHDTDEGLDPTEENIAKFERFLNSRVKGSDPFAREKGIQGTD